MGEQAEQEVGIIRRIALRGKIGGAATDQVFGGTGERHIEQASDFMAIIGGKLLPAASCPAVRDPLAFRGGQHAGQPVRA